MPKETYQPTNEDSRKARGMMTYEQGDLSYDRQRAAEMSNHALLEGLAVRGGLLMRSAREQDEELQKKFVDREKLKSLHERVVAEDARLREFKDEALRRMESK